MTLLFFRFHICDNFVSFHACWTALPHPATNNEQSRYFECDDSDLFMGDCYEYSVASDEQDDDIEECSFYKYSIQQSENCNSNSMSFRTSDGNSSNNILATSHIATTNISHSQENILHGNCMGMCDKGIQYDESLFVQNDENEEDDEEKKAQVPGAAIPEVNNDWRNRLVLYVLYSINLRKYRISRMEAKIKFRLSFFIVI